MDTSALDDAAAASSDYQAKAVSVAVVGLIFGGICVVLRRRPWTSRLCICIFVTSLVSTQLLMKRLQSPPLNYKFPGCVTAIHFGTVWLICVAYWGLQGDPRKLWPMSAGSRRRYATLVLPIAFSLPLSVVFNNVALSFIGAGLNGIIGTLAPITTAILSHTLGRRISSSGWCGIGIAGIGAFILGSAEWVESKANASLIFGCTLSMISVLLRSSKVVLQDQLLAPGAYEAGRQSPSVAPAASLSSMHVWGLQAPPCMLVALAYAMGVEDASQAWAEFRPDVQWMVFASCVSATVLNLLGMYSIKELGASSMQIVGKLNTIILCAFSVAFLGETLPFKVVLGAGIIVVGIAYFEQASAEARSRKPTSPTSELDASKVFGNTGSQSGTRSELPL